MALYPQGEAEPRKGKRGTSNGNAAPIPVSIVDKKGGSWPAVRERSGLVACFTVKVAQQWPFKMLSTVKATTGRQYYHTVGVFILLATGRPPSPNHRL
jgi:hypothetical protein